MLNDSALDGMEDELDQVIEPVNDMDSGVPRFNAGNPTSTYAALRQSRELFAAKKGQLEKQVGRLLYLNSYICHICMDLSIPSKTTRSIFFFYVCRRRLR